MVYVEEESYDEEKRRRLEDEKENRSFTEEVLPGQTEIDRQSGRDSALYQQEKGIRTGNLQVPVDRLVTWGGGGGGVVRRGP